MYFNSNSAFLAKISVERGESILLKSGAICTTTGKYTGRAPNAKAYVLDELTTDLIDWGSNNSITEAEFEKELKSFIEYKDAVNPIFCQTVTAVKDDRYSIGVVTYTEKAKHALFVRNMFIPSTNVYLTDPNAFKIYHFPNKEPEAKVLISLKRRIVLITGSDYSGEIKKSIFSALNFMLPQAGHLPMHCSVNVDKNRENPAIFFGLSGTGKTTLSSDENRVLIGDDEHGWTDTGLTNFEGGCYAKTIRLSKEAEPQIWDACNKNEAILENVVCNNGTPDFCDGSITENTRASYPCSNILGADKKGFVSKHPKNIVMLTCDAFGVLPAVMKLSPEEAVKQFLLGYTAKVAGTEAGVKEPQATFSACFGAPFMPLSPEVYSEILKGKMVEHDTDCWLVNTGWTGGSYGTGSRMPISVTRLIIDKIHDGTLSKCKTFFHKQTGFDVPICPEIPETLLVPETSWDSLEDYNQKSQQLMKLFSEQEARIFKLA